MFLGSRLLGNILRRMNKRNYNNNNVYQVLVLFITPHNNLMRYALLSSPLQESGKLGLETLSSVRSPRIRPKWGLLVLAKARHARTSQVLKEHPILPPELLNSASRRTQHPLLLARALLVHLQPKPCCRVGNLMGCPAAF